MEVPRQQAVRRRRNLPARAPRRLSPGLGGSGEPLALASLQVLPGEYSQELYTLAGSIYRQSRAQLPTGTLAELEAALPLAPALQRGWL